jgi:hypothetical protein
MLPRTNHEWALILTIAVGVFYSPLYDRSFRLAGIYLDAMDIVFLGLVTYYLVKALLSGAHTIKIRFYLVAFIIIGLMVLATFIGLAHGNYWKTIFRETKMVVYFGMIPIITQAIWKGQVNLKRVYAWLIIFASIGSIYDLYVRAIGYYPSSPYGGGSTDYIAYAYTPVGRIIRDFGWVSTYHYQVFVCIILIPWVLQSTTWKRRILLSSVLVLNLIANLLTITRGFMLALILGVLILLLQIPVRIYLNGQVVIHKIAFRIIAFGLAACILFGAAIQFVPQLQAPFFRLFSVVAPEYAGLGDVGTTDLRLSSIRLGWQTATRFPFGMGFGVETSIQNLSASDHRIMTLLFHNSLGYIFYVFGGIGGSLIIILLAILGIRVFYFTLVEPSGENKYALATLTGLYTALLAMSFTSGNFLFAIGNVLPFTILMLSVLAAIRKGLVL